MSCWNYHRWCSRLMQQLDSTRISRMLEEVDPKPELWIRIFYPKIPRRSPIRRRLSSIDDVVTSERFSHMLAHEASHMRTVPATGKKKTAAFWKGRRHRFARAGGGRSGISSWWKSRAQAQGRCVWIWITVGAAPLFVLRCLRVRACRDGTRGAG